MQTITGAVCARARARACPASREVLGGWGSGQRTPGVTLVTFVYHPPPGRGIPGCVLVRDGSGKWSNTRFPPEPDLRCALSSKKPPVYFVCENLETVLTWCGFTPRWLEAGRKHLPWCGCVLSTCPGPSGGSFPKGYLCPEEEGAHLGAVWGSAACQVFAS